MLPEDHFLALVVGEALKPVKDWRLTPPGPEFYTPDIFGVDPESTSSESAEEVGSPDEGVYTSQSASGSERIQFRFVSSEEQLEVATTKNDTSTKAETFGVLLAQLHFILSILSQDQSYLRLPTTRNIHQCKLVGGGHSFNVRRASAIEIPDLEELPNQYFVVKTANITNERDATARMRDILREVRVLTHEPLRSHPNVVSLLGFGWEQQRVSTESTITRWPYLLLEYAEYGSMVDVFEQHVVGLQMRMSFCVDVGNGLAALHAAEVVHGDIKLENVLIFPGTGGHLTAKITDFGFASIDLDGSQPSVSFRRGTLPWKAPEADLELSWKDQFLTDVYSYGFLIWRTMAYGHHPFLEAGGLVTMEIFEKLERGKLVDGYVLTMALESILRILPAHQSTKVSTALANSLQRHRSERKLSAAVSVLRGVFIPGSVQPLRIKQIPGEQGLGIYEYGIFDKSLEWQMMQALRCFCGSRPAFEGPLAPFLGHCAYTLSNWHFDRWTAGVQADSTGTTTRSLAWKYIAISACSETGAASAEALYSIFYTLWPDNETIPVGIFPLFSGRALRHGMEFILREVMENDVPGKERFLAFFTTRLCRGVKVIGPPDPYIPLIEEQSLLTMVEQGRLTPEAAFRMAATWRQSSTIRVICSRFTPDVNGQDVDGETALLRACRAGDYVIAVWLLKTAKADPAIATKLGITPLHWIHVFSGDEAISLAKLLTKRGANANAIAVNNGSCTAESAFWFFKGPPLIRCIAVGNEAAVRALLAIGADPLIPISPGNDNSIVFAARRLRAPVLEILLKTAPTYPVCEIDSSGYSLLAKVIASPIQYAAKIHGRRHENPRIETFGLVWNWKIQHRSLFRRPQVVESTEKRMLRSITGRGRIPLQLAVTENNMVTVKYLMKIASDAIDSGPLFAERMANVGLQCAVMYEKPAMVEYFLSVGAHPLQPQFYVLPENEHQILPSYKTPRMALREKNVLHLCAHAGTSASAIGPCLIKTLMPDYYQNLSEDQKSARRQYAIELVDYLYLPGGTDHPIIDKRDEEDNTPFFAALLNEEYELARALRFAGANKNALIRDTPILEHVLTWSPVAGRIALEFLVRGVWGNLWMSRHPRRHYLDLAIAASKDWPAAQAADFVSDVVGYVHPRHAHETGVYNGYRVVRLDGGPTRCGCRVDWDAHIAKAVEQLQPHAVAELVLRREPIAPKDSFSPINSLRRTLLGLKAPQDLDERRDLFRAWKSAVEILPIIQGRYPDHRFDVSHLLQNIAGKITEHVGPELEISAARFRAGALSSKGVAYQINRLLTPFLGIAAGCSSGEVGRLQELVQGYVPQDAKVKVVVRKREQEKEGLEAEIKCDEEVGTLGLFKPKAAGERDLRCEIWE